MSGQQKIKEFEKKHHDKLQNRYVHYVCDIARNSKLNTPIVEAYRDWVKMEFYAYTRKKFMGQCYSLRRAS